MISTDTRTTDLDDVAVLFYAMCKFGEENELATGVLLVSVGFGELLRRAERAAEVIAEYHAEGAGWNGSSWFELLRQSHWGSMAAHLFLLNLDAPGDRVEILVRICLESDGL